MSSSTERHGCRERHVGVRAVGAGASPHRGLLRRTDGQATVEAAFLIPLICLLLIMLCQPLILLYDRMVMEAAAAEGCRLIATQTSSGGGRHAGESYEAAVRRRLGSIPPIDCFHIHEGGCSYRVELVGDENSEYVSVAITNKLRLLPVAGLGARMLGRCDGDRVYTQHVEVRVHARPSWTTGGPEDWIGHWR